MLRKMGQFLSGYLGRGGKAPSEFELDLNPADKATESGDDLEVYESLAQLNEVARAQLEAVQSYEGQSVMIRDALSNPKSNEKQIAALEALLPNAATIHGFHEVAMSIESVTSRVVPLLLDTTEQGLAGKKGLMKQFADLLFFVFKFDQMKMMKPELQNDFSFYRRTLSKNPSHPGIVVDEMAANNVSMFIAQASPMLTALGKALGAVDSERRKAGAATTHVGEGQGGKGVVIHTVEDFLASTANILCSMAIRKLPTPEEQLYVVTVMTIAIVVYDHTSRSGVFRKTSGHNHVEIKKCVQQIKALPKAEAEPLLSTVQYSSRTFKQAPEGVQKLVTSRSA